VTVSSQLPPVVDPCAVLARTAVERLLQALCDQLGLATAAVVEIDGHKPPINVVVGTDLGTPRLPAGVAARVLAGEQVLLVGEQLASDDQAEVTAVAAGPIRDDTGRLIGILYGVDRLPHRGLDERDGVALRALAGLAGPLLQALQAAVDTAPGVAQIAEVVERAVDLEHLTRPLLQVLQQVSGLASACLTTLDHPATRQQVAFSANARESQGFVLPEGLGLPWDDSLCKRALDEGRASSAQVAQDWGDNVAAAALGIATFVSVPVRLSDGRLWGTLCAADDVSRPDVHEHLPLLGLFAGLIAAQVERADVADRRGRDARIARRLADTDLLTGCAQPRAVEPWLVQALDALAHEEVVVALLVDLDAFTLVNERHGQATGDAVLAALGDRLRSVGRTGDLVARVGGDEFLVAAVLPRSAVASLATRVRAAADFDVVHAGRTVRARCSVGCAVSDETGEPMALVALADVEMYREKSLHGR
jgi:diguanylate cyclase (GGDEF)-like protein